MRTPARDGGFFAASIGQMNMVVTYEKSADGRVGLITLNRPGVLNAYNLEMRDALFEVLLAVRDDDEVRVVVLRGSGRAFCTGGDLQEFGTAPSPIGAREARWRRDVWGTLWSLPKLTMAAVHGLVVGGGFELMLLCDLALAAADARFWLPETGLGMMPGVGGTQSLPRLVGTGRALDLVLSGRVLRATEALRLGLLSKVVRPDRLHATACRQAHQLARRDPARVRQLKRSLNEGLDLALGQALALEQRLSGAGEIE